MAGAMSLLIGFARRVKRGFQRHGVIGLAGVGAEYLVQLFSSLRPSVRAEIREREQRAKAFDERFGVDTAGCIHQTELNVKNPNQAHAVAYGGSDPKLFSDAFKALALDYHRYVFVDFGSGKGRALLMATAYPFKRIVGVEFSEELHRIAQENIARFNAGAMKCADVKSVCMDAVAYQLPDDCLVCYFCNPFDATIMAQVVDNIRKSYLQSPRDIFIVYYNPREGHLLDQSDCFRHFETCANIRIWRTAPGANSSMGSAQ
jgi:SAM-dependent methyltransferase